MAAHVNSDMVDPHNARTLSSLVGTESLRIFYHMTKSSGSVHVRCSAQTGAQAKLSHGQGKSGAHAKEKDKTVLMMLWMGGQA